MYAQQCKFYASQGFCKFGDSCFYDHKTTDQNKTLKAQFEDLKSKHDEILKVTSKHEEKIRFLEYKLDMLGRQMIGAVREMPEHIEHIEDVAKEDEQVEEMDIEHIKRKSKVNLDGSYDIYEDVQFKEIMEKQRDIAFDLKVNLDEVQSSLKKSKVDETLSRLQELKSKIQRDEKEMKRMIEKDIRYTAYNNCRISSFQCRRI